MPETPTFPTARFAFDEQEIDIERRTISGGTAISGEEDLIETDGGGRVFAEFMAGPLLEREDNLAWRAIGTRFGSGTVPIIVPFCDCEHQPYGNEHLVTHSDDSPFSDESEYSGGGPLATASANAALRATTISLDIDFPQALLGGEWFSIEHPTKGWRAYNIMTVVAQDDTTATVTFLPPLREAVTEGDVVDFAEPRCLMRVDGRPPRKIEIGRYGEAAIRFVEAP